MERLVLLLFATFDWLVDSSIYWLLSVSSVPRVVSVLYMGLIRVNVSSCENKNNNDKQQQQ